MGVHPCTLVSAAWTRICVAKNKVCNRPVREVLPPLVSSNTMTGCWPFLSREHCHLPAGPCPARSSKAGISPQARRRDSKNWFCRRVRSAMVRGPSGLSALRETRMSRGASRPVPADDRCPLAPSSSPGREAGKPFSSRCSRI